MKNKMLAALAFVGLSCGLSTSAYKEGAFLYETHCSSCHGHDAEGLGSWYPSLRDTAYLRLNRINMAPWIRHGISRDSASIFHGRFNQADMPENKVLKAADISNILNFLNERHWKFNPFSIAEVEASLRSKGAL